MANGDVVGDGSEGGWMGAPVVMLGGSVRVARRRISRAGVD